ncbi:unnamed protein product [Effrenium voratum]|uniref:Uncharacterized protein n=1 Tax=Effrenium voratum TaxID=2562239 RepID=A0AA36IB85_9DINO|nr:unnamed protein product [Effrenium voratum]
MAQALQDVEGLQDEDDKESEERQDKHEAVQMVRIATWAAARCACGIWMHKALDKGFSAGEARLHQRVPHRGICNGNGPRTGASQEAACKSFGTQHQQTPGQPFRSV